MFFAPRRPLLGAAMLGGTAFLAGRAGQRAAEREADEQARLAQLEGGQQPAQQQAQPSLVDNLARLAQLKDSGALTESDFEAAKQKLLAS